MASRTLILYSIILSALFVAACSSSNDSKQDNNSASSPNKTKNTDSKPVDGDWLVYNLGAEPATLNPITARDAYESTVNGDNVYESLVKRDNESLEIVPQLAESWEISEDKLTFTFKIKENIRWHDGKPFTSEDVVFSFNKIMDPKVDSARLKAYYQEIKNVEAIDSHTVKFTYSRPYFLALEFCGGMPIVPKHIFDKGDFNKNPAGRHPIGTGPYLFSKWDTGREIVLEKNPDYWGEKPHLDKIVFKIINDPNVAFQVLRKGEVDFAGLTPIQWEKQSTTKKFEEKFNKHAYFRPNYSYIGWNLDRPFFSDKKVRKAMTHLVNRELILEKILFNLGTTVTNPFYINGKEYDKSIMPLEFSPEKAKLLLNEAGWVDSDSDGIRDKNGVKFEFEFLIPNASDTSEKISTILKEEMDKVGIIMNIRKIEWAVFVQRLNERKFDAVTLGWSMGVESDPYQVWHSSQMEGGGSNFIGFKNEEADRIIEQARKEFDKEKRIKLYRKFISIIHDEQPYTFLFCRKSTIAVNKRFHGINVYPLGVDFLEWYVPAKLQKYH
ncbi:MAG: peptide-binding protein [Candidatus Dadabacteria bacterium]|nr:peptide-binding protein [Candidatus Dadabacteria bacterium]NIX15852.1 peptide-binding protein [Candidatus Dadabacteria bacterium]NIY22571.1 peptide-binding protein [Candidatus Dadabacteria bacterium]